MKTKTQTMSQKLRYLFGILGTILLGTWLYIIFCCCDCNENSVKKPSSTFENSKVDASKTNQNGFGFKNSQINYYCTDNFNFGNPNHELLLPVSDSIDLGISKLKKELANSTSKFRITGLYSNSETNNSIFPDLGIARANAIKNYLISKGFPENKLILNSELNNNSTTEENSTYKTSKFALLDNSVIANGKNISKDWNAVKAEINNTPLILYFNTGQANIQLTEQEKAKIASLVDYLNNVENSKLSIIGYTDNSPGVRNTNEFYSQERAKFAKSYFVKNGIPENKIETIGKGPSNPIADNNSEQGKAKNRSAEVHIK
jgi:outer membrane protein OmpA-like peptidoglycan-associated protein